MLIHRLQGLHWPAAAHIDEQEIRETTGLSVVLIVALVVVIDGTRNKRSESS